MKYGTPTRLKYRMPYNKTSVIQSISPKAQMRLKWMDYVEQRNSIRKASRHFDIPESVIRYWKKKYQPYNLKTLEDKKKTPHKVRTSPISLEEAQRVIELRLKYKGWGKTKIQVLLEREDIHIGQTRIQKIINGANLKRIPHAKKKYYRRKNRKHMYAVPKQVLKKPGGLVYLDVKHLYLPDGQRVYQFTAIDHVTRLMRIKLFTNITSRCGKLFLDYLQQEYPFKRIHYIGSDNGSEFMGEMDEELKKRKIIHVFSSPRSPKQNPFVERVIKTVIDDVYYFEGLEVSMKKQQEVLDRYVKVYNEIRPHESLNLKTPFEMFRELSN